MNNTQAMAEWRARYAAVRARMALRQRVFWCTAGLVFFTVFLPPLWPMFVSVPLMILAILVAQRGNQRDTQHLALLGEMQHAARVEQARELLERLRAENQAKYEEALAELRQLAQDPLMGELKSMLDKHYPEA